jgi:hypothetical protein
MTVKRERLELANCLWDTLTAVKKYRLSRKSSILEASCAAEIEAAVEAARNQLKDELTKQIIPNMLAYNMVEKPSEYK